jgi:HK97 family phage portal protein
MSSMDVIREQHPAQPQSRGLVQRAIDYAARRTVQTRAVMSRPVSFVGSSAPIAQLRLTEGERRWSASAVAYRAITAISSNASSLDLQVIRSDDSVIEGHWLTQLWASPNPLMSGRVLGEWVWQRMETRGEAFLYLDRGESGVGEVGAMWPIFGGVSIVVDKNLAGEIVAFVVDVGGKRVPLLPSEVLWLRYPDAENEWGALAPLRAAAHAVGLDAYARAWQQGELKNGARPTAVVYLGDLDEDQHDEVVDAYRSRIEGAHNAGRTLFVSSKEAAKVERLSLTPAELGWLDTRRTSWEEVLLAFGVSKDYLLGGATHENRDAARATLWSDTIIGKLEVVAGELARQLLPSGERARFDTDNVDALRENEDSRAKRTNEATDRDVLLLDEARAAYGLDPLPGGVGQLTLTAYRMLLQLEAQSALLQANPEARQLPPVRVGPLAAVERTTQLALPVAASRRVGLTFDEAQHEYDVHEKIGVRAVKRLASAQEQIVLNNLSKLMGRSGMWATKRDSMHEAIEVLRDRLLYVEDETPEETQARVQAELAVRAAADDLLDAEKAAAMTRDQIESFLAGVWTRGGSVTAQALGVGFDVFEPLVLDRMEARLDELAGQVTETTRRVLEEKVLLEGVAAGESIDELAVRVRSIFADLSGWRAQMIARTETVGGFNGASFTTAGESGVVTARYWLATGDQRTRDSHIAVDNERLVSFEQRYSNGCLHPGNGPAAEVIMCRCTEQYDVD